MKHMLNFVDFTPKRLGQVASDSNGGLICGQVINS